MKQIAQFTIKDHAGFTLIEVMVVVTIIAAVLTMVVPRMSNPNRELKSTLRKFSVLSKDLHSRAKLSNATYRIAIDLKSGQESNEAQSYWVEKSTSPQPFKKPKDIAELIKKASENKSDDEKKNDGVTPDGFQIESRIFKEPKALPTGLTFSEVELASAEGSFKEGIVYIHYSPKGLVEESAIHLKAGEDIEWTLAIHPLTGKAELARGYLSLKEIMDQ